MPKVSKRKPQPQTKPLKTPKHKYKPVIRGKIWQALSKLFYAILSLLFISVLYIFKRKQKQQPNPLVHLPEAILYQIYAELSLIDQTCFSLSSNRLFKIFGPVVNGKLFDFEDPMDPVLKSMKEGVIEIRLADYRFVYYSSFVRLHHSQVLGQSQPLEPYRDGLGTVNLCSGIALTLRDREDIMDLLLAIHYNDDDAEQLLDKWSHLFKVAATEKGPQYLEHKCRNRSHNVEAHLRIQVYPKPDSLKMESQYTLEKNHRTDYVDADPILACPHADIISLLMADAEWAYCVSCDVGIVLFSGSDSSSDHVLIYREFPLPANPGSSDTSKE